MGHKTVKGERWDLMDGATYQAEATKALTRITGSNLSLRQIKKEAQTRQMSIVEPGSGQGACGHKRECTCRMCQAIRTNVARGIAGQQERARMGFGQMSRKAASKLKRDRFFENLTDKDSPTFARPLASAVEACPGQHIQTAAKNAKHWLETDARSRILLADAQAGITDEYLANKRLSLMEAKKTEFFAHKGEVISERTRPDHAVQVRATELTHRLRGEMPKEEADVQTALILRIGDRPINPDDWQTFVTIEDAKATVAAAERSHESEVAKPAESLPGR